MGELVEGEYQSRAWWLQPPSLWRVSEHCLGRQCWSDLWTMASLGNYKWAGRGCNTAPSVWGILSQPPACLANAQLAHQCTVRPHHQHNSSSFPSYLPTSSPDLCGACGSEMKTDFLCRFFSSRRGSASWNVCQQRNSGLSPYI